MFGLVTRNDFSPPVGIKGKHFYWSEMPQEHSVAKDFLFFGGSDVTEEVVIKVLMVRHLILLQLLSPPTVYKKFMYHRL